MKKSSSKSPESCKCGKRTSSGSPCKVDVSGSPCRFHATSSPSQRKGKRGRSSPGQSSPLSAPADKFALEKLPVPALYEILLRKGRGQKNALCRTSKKFAKICALTRFQYEYDALHPFGKMMYTKRHVYDARQSYILENKRDVESIKHPSFVLTFDVWLSTRSETIEIKYESTRGLLIEIGAFHDGEGLDIGVKLRNRDGLVRFDTQEKSGNVVQTGQPESIREELDKEGKSEWYISKDMNFEQKRKVVKSVYMFFKRVMEDAGINMSHDIRLKWLKF